jgi:hypothetical protein
MQVVDPIYRLYERWFDGDLDGIIAEVDERIDAEYFDVLPYPGRYHGRAAWSGLLAVIASEFSILDVAPHDFIAGEDFVLVQGHYFGVHHTGLIDADFVHLWYLVAGRPLAFGSYATAQAAWAVLDRYDLNRL